MKLEEMAEKRRLEYEQNKKRIQEQEIKERQENEALAYRIRLVESGLNLSEINNRTFAKFDVKNLNDGEEKIQQVINFINSKRDNVLTLYGNNGRGKTFIANAICFEMVKNIGVFYSQVGNLLFTLRKKEFDGTYFDFMEKLQNIPLLVIDDYGDFKETDYSIANLDMLIDYRYEYKKKTVITTNKSLVELTKFNKRVASRLMSGICIELVGEDYRLKSMKKRIGK